MFELVRPTRTRPRIDEPSRLRRLEIERSLRELRELGVVSSADEELAEAVARAARPEGLRVRVMAVRSLAVTRYVVGVCRGGRPRAA